MDGPYYWLLHKLRLYKPVTWEYSRLNITHCVMSKRKLKFLVNGGYMSGWDDPRMQTLDGLRRRGYSAAVVNRFCEEIGVTRSKMTAKIELLEALSRQELDATAPRRFAVLRPLQVRARVAATRTPRERHANATRTPRERHATAAGGAGRAAQGRKGLCRRQPPEGRVDGRAWHEAHLARLHREGRLPRGRRPQGATPVISP